MKRGLGRFVRQPVAPAKVSTEHRSLATFAAQFAASDASTSGEYTVAWQVPSAWRASTLLSGLIGAMPLDGYTAKPSGIPALTQPQPLALQSFTAYRTNIDVMASWVNDYLFHGNAIGVVGSRDKFNNAPTSYVPVPASWVSVMPAHGRSWNDVETLSGDVRYRIGNAEYGPWDILHVRGPARPGALRGMGVLEAALSTFQLANDQREQASSVGTHGVPTGLLYADDVDVTKEELAESKSDFMRGQQNGRTIAALQPGVKFQALAWNPEELQLIEARKMSDADMALLFGLPASFLNVEGSSLTYSNIGQDWLNLLKSTVNAIITRFEEEFTRLMPPGEFARFDREAVLETDTLTRYQAYATADWMTVDEKRHREGLAPLPKPAPAPAPLPAPSPAPDAPEGKEEAA